MSRRGEGAHDRDTVRSMVGTALPGWTIESVGSYAGEDNGVYPVTVAADGHSRQLVLKAPVDTDPAAFEPEPYLLEAVARRTDVPVPGVVAVVADGDDQPFFLMEHREGTVLAERADALVPAARDRLVRDAGEHLGQLHLLGSFEGFGPVRVRETPLEGPSGGDEPSRSPSGDSPERSPSGGDPPALGGDGDAAPGDPSGAGDEQPGAADDAAGGDGAAGGISASGPDVSHPAHAAPAHLERGIEAPTFDLGVTDARPDWATWFREGVDADLAALDGRFADLQADVRAALSAVEVPDADPVVVHGDYRFRNLLADPDTGDTRAVLDFDAPATGAARADLVRAVDRLSAWAPLGSDRRRRVTECLLVGYETATGRRPDLDDPACDAYRLASRLPALAAFDRRHADTCPDEREALAERHRDAVAELAGRCTL